MPIAGTIARGMLGLAGASLVIGSAAWGLTAAEAVAVPALVAATGATIALAGSIFTLAAGVTGVGISLFTLSKALQFTLNQVGLAPKVGIGAIGLFSGAGNSSSKTHNDNRQVHHHDNRGPRITQNVKPSLFGKVEAPIANVQHYHQEDHFWAQKAFNALKMLAVPVLAYAAYATFPIWAPSVFSVNPNESPNPASEAVQLPVALPSLPSATATRLPLPSPTAEQRGLPTSTRSSAAGPPSSPKNPAPPVASLPTPLCAKSMDTTLFGFLPASKCIEWSK